MILKFLLWVLREHCGCPISLCGCQGTHKEIGNHAPGPRDWGRSGLETFLSTMNHIIGFSTSGNPTKHMPIGYWSLWGQPRSVTSGDLRWPWNSCDARSRVTASHVLTPITSTVPIQVNRNSHDAKLRLLTISLKSCRRLFPLWRHNFVTWPDLTKFFHQKLRKGRPISYRKFQHHTPNDLACSSENLMGGSINPPLHWRGLTRHRLGCFCTHHSLGGGVGSDPPPCYLENGWT